MTTLEYIDNQIERFRRKRKHWLKNNELIAADIANDAVEEINEIKLMILKQRGNDIGEIKGNIKDNIKDRCNQDCGNNENS